MHLVHDDFSENVEILSEFEIKNVFCINVWCFYLNLRCQFKICHQFCPIISCFGTTIWPC